MILDATIGARMVARLPREKRPTVQWVAVPLRLEVPDVSVDEMSPALHAPLSIHHFAGKLERIAPDPWETLYWDGAGIFRRKGDEPISVSELYLGMRTTSPLPADTRFAEIVEDGREAAASFAQDAALRRLRVVEGALFVAEHEPVFVLDAAMVVRFTRDWRYGLRGRGYRADQFDAFVEELRAQGVPQRSLAAFQRARPTVHRPEALVFDPVHNGVVRAALALLEAVKSQIKHEAEVAHASMDLEIARAWPDLKQAYLGAVADPYGDIAPLAGEVERLARFCSVWKETAKAADDAIDAVGAWRRAAPAVNQALPVLQI